ncbi:MAG: hypothetical protein JW751_07705 [Polyangiaceae bacterium]|nr:hypothetical protein [Polyangiaceae bacterium]
MRHGTFLFCAGVLALGCGDRSSAWDADYESVSAGGPPTQGLSGSVAVRDDALDRLVMITSPGGRDLTTKALPVGKGIVYWQTDAKRERLFVLSEGVQPRRERDDEKPSLTVIDGGGWREVDGRAEFHEPSILARYELDDPPNPVLYLDPEGEYAVVTVGGGVVENPNELLLVNLPEDGDDEPTIEAKTIRSFGSSPQAISFTKRLRFPDGIGRRMMIVQTEQEVALIDPENLDTEITVRLSEPLNGVNMSSPVEVAVHDNQRSQFDPDDGERFPIIAIRLRNRSTVPLLSFEAAPSEAEAGVETTGVDFLVTVNIAEVGSVPSDIDFFWTEVDAAPALRLAALLPNRSEVALVNPDANYTDYVALGAAYDHMTRVTDDVAVQPLNSDVALLTGQSVYSVAFWELGSTGTRSYRSLETHSIGIPINQIIPITQDASAPDGEDYGHLKLLRGVTASEFYVLDLNQRQSAPMLTTGTSGANITPAPDGQRAWVSVANEEEIASVRFSDLHPTTLVLERPVAAVYDIAQPETTHGSPSRVAIALHIEGASLGATVLDARAPDTADTRFYGGILLGGIR